MLAWARRIADGQWPYRDFWANYAPGQPVVARRAGQAVRPVTAVVAHRAGRDRCDGRPCSPRLRRRRAGTGWALGAWVAAAGAMAWPSGPGPNPARSRLRSERCWPRGARRWPRARWPGWRSSCGPRSAWLRRIGAALAARRRARAAPGRARRLPRRPSRCSRSRPSPSWPGRHGRPGARLRRQAGPPAAALPAGLRRRLRPQQAARVLLPGDPGGRQRAMGGVGAGAPRRAALAPLVAVALPTCSPAPTSSIWCRSRWSWPLRWPARRGASATSCCAAALGVVLGLVALHGVERRAGQALPSARAGGDPAPAADGVRTAPADAAALRASSPTCGRARRAGRRCSSRRRASTACASATRCSTCCRPPQPDALRRHAAGVVTTAKVQREMARDLPAAAGRRALALAAGARAEPNGSGRSSGVFVLDRAIARGYRPAARFGDYLVLVRR